jgi:hypothetical protein
MKNKNSKKNKANRNPKSMKGKKGTVGAPLKPMKFPKTGFTVNRIVEMNPEVCELTVRNRFNRMLKAGEIVRLQDKPQAGGAVGRPNRQYLLKVNVTKETVLFDPNAPKAETKPAPAKRTAKAKAPRKTRKAAPSISDTAVLVNDVPTPDVVSLAPATPAPEAPAPSETPVLTNGTESASTPTEPEKVTAPASTVFA